VIAALEQEKKSLHDRMLRIAADFENYKKRSKREHDDAAHRAREQVLRELLPIADNLERALAHSAGGDPGSILDGVRLVLRQLGGALEKLEVRPITVVGETFDPNLHEAIQQVESAEHAPGTITTELQRGYTLAGRLLRPAMVVVSKAPPAPAEAAPPETAEPSTDAAPNPPGEPEKN
jgi:molecular chaperone GrpE